MTKDQRIIRAKTGRRELAKQLGSVSQTCRIMGYAATASIVSRTFTTKAANWPCGSSHAASRC
jgi:hypothetical protein